MPVSSRSQRAEARYNVTTEFPHLGLHSAAATGNIGLVKYALSHGQPINSVIDGVLPLHAACAGGNDLVVKLLIDNGADVNAPRLPRRYSSDKSRTPSAPIVGNSGSTPLHFAAANGHTHVVHTLLRHGARPDRADKHGVTPATLARQSGWIATADAIQDWLANRDQDLRERETMLGNPEPPDQEDDPAGYVRARHASICGCAPGECVHTARSRRLAMKRSIDNVIHRFKSSSSLTAPNALAAYPDSSSSPDDAYTCATPDSVESPVPPRRPSLTPQDDLPSPKSRRPSSAGTGAEPSKEKAPRKLASKYALLHRFKRPSAEALSARSSPSPHPHRTSSSTQPQPQTQEQERVDASKPLVDSPLPLPITPARRRSASHHRSHSALDDTPASSPPSVRPGILRAHGRSSSSGQSQMSSSSHLHAPPPRALRFNHARPSRAEFDEFDEDAEAEADLDPDFDDDFDLEFEDDEDEDEYEYGQPIPSRLLDGGEGGGGRDRRPRGRSITSTQSLSPLSENPLARAGVDFPFSINRPPEEDAHAVRPSSLPTPSHAHAHAHANGADGRARGDSMSTTGTQSSAGVRTPAPAPAHLASVASPAPSTREIDYPVEAAYPLPAPAHVPAGAWSKDRPRPHAIDIAAISSHAQAEELVQRAQRSVLELAHAPEPAGARARGRSPCRKRRPRLG
ncbi:hypothetical protein OF83DRAFT_888528 [Amylostereum chailletii]|nr:hypothetical protein OF83DRAFT_888528 [Amylostereum chailletii]